MLVVREEYCKCVELGTCTTCAFKPLVDICRPSQGVHSQGDAPRLCIMRCAIVTCMSSFVCDSQWSPSLHGVNWRWSSSLTLRAQARVRGYPPKLRQQHVRSPDLTT